MLRCPGESHIEKTPFLFKVTRFVFGMVGNQPVFTAGDKNHRKFQSFGSMQRQQGYVFNPIIIGVRVLTQRHICQKPINIGTRLGRCRHELCKTAFKTGIIRIGIVQPELRDKE